MPESVSINHEQGYIRVRTWGNVSEAEMLESKRQVRQFCRESGITSVLVDATELDSLPGTVEIFDFASSLGSYFSADVRFAIVSSETAWKDMSFLETVSLNRGLRGRLFDSKTEAIAWLQKPTLETDDSTDEPMLHGSPS